MTTCSEAPAIRRLGALEIYSASRHHLGIFRTVIVTCRYHIPPAIKISPESTELLYTALKDVVTQHPMLRVGILGEETNEPAFGDLHTIDLAQNVRFETLQGGSQGDYEDELARLQGWYHDQLWQGLHSRPPWKLVIIKSEENVFNDFTDFMFSFHHSLSGGTGGRFFHEDLLEALNRHSVTSFQKLPAISPRLVFPEPPSLPGSLETTIPFTSSYWFWIKSFWKYLAPSMLQPASTPLWYGLPVDYSLPYKTRIHAVDIDPEILTRLLQACRTHLTSLTALIHAMLLMSLSRQLALHQPSIPPGRGPKFCSQTPISLAPYLAHPDNPSSPPSPIVNLVTAAHHSHSSEIASAMGTASSSDVDGLIWREAKRVKEEITYKTSTLPADDEIMLLKYISDWKTWWAKQDGMPRSHSWEVSNIGVLRHKQPAPITSMDPLRQEEEQIQATRILFSNCAMVAGAAVGVNVGSVQGGVLTLTLSWQEGVVEEALVRSLAGDLRAYTRNFAKTGRFIS